MIQIPDREITNIEGRAWKTAATDEDGEVIFEDMDQKIVKRRPATVADMIRTAIFSVPQAGQKKLDPVRIMQVSNHLLNAQNSTIELKEKQYEWLHRLLVREIPPSKEAKEVGVTDDIPLAMALWGSVNYLWFIEQLKTEAEMRTLEDMLEAMDDKDED